MKNYGLLVKEIPIIFRGNVEKSRLSDPDATSITKTFTSGPAGSNYIKTDTGTQTPTRFDIKNKTEIYVEYDGIYYGKLTRQDVYGGDKNFGATLASNTYDFSVYPFSIYTNNANTFLLHAPIGTDPEKTVRIWLTEPSIVIGKKILSAELTGNGQLNRFYARFACGENGTLHLKPYVILNGNIRIDLCNFAQGGDQYIAGDNETISFDCFVPVETHAVAYVEAENVGEYPSVIDAAMVVQYEDFIESESIVGYEGINLRRR